jgi:bla regulator protein blaR1
MARPTPGRLQWAGGFLFAAAAWIAFYGAPFALDQSGAAQCGTGSQAAQAGVKHLEFAAVSIRRNKAGGPQEFGAATPDGYRMRNMFLAAPILMAYVPLTGGASTYSDDQVEGLPQWLESDDDRYDIDAKVDDRDLAKWQNPELQPAMLRLMLQSMLADRLKLVVHRGTKIGPVYSLVVGKNGPNFKETDPGDPHAGSYPFPGGGRISMELSGGQMKIHYFAISVSQLATMWSGQEGRPVQEKTGLIGKYDITIEKTARTAAPAAAPPDSPAPDTEPSIFSLAQGLGLKLEPARGQIETLVIDHVERPSQN